MALRILLVDNEPDVLKVVKGLAESMGYEVESLNDSLEAAQVVNLRKFDGAIVSASTPLMDGFVLVRYIRFSTSNRGIPIIMLSKVADAQTMQKAFNAGTTYFVSKPLDPQKLQGVLSSMRGQMLKEKRSYARRPVRTPVVCIADMKQFKSLSVNLSQGGMLLEASDGLEVGQSADLQFTLPGIPGQVNLRAMVVRREPSGRMAVQFTLVGPAEHKALGAFIAGVVQD